MTSANPFPSIAEQQEAELRLRRAELETAQSVIKLMERDRAVLISHTHILHEDVDRLQKHRVGLWLSLIATWAFGLFFTVPRWFAQ